MNRTAIEWTDRTWNPITGCLGGCSYCYARGMARRFGRTPEARAFKPAFHAERLAEPARLRRPSRIFICSTADLYGDGVGPEWSLRVVQAARDVPRHTYQILTKRPRRLVHAWAGAAPPLAAFWLGATATDQASWDAACAELRRLPSRFTRWISAEPVLGPIEPGVWVPDWVVVGALSGRGRRRQEESRALGTRLVGRLEHRLSRVFSKGSMLGGPREWPA